MKIELHAHTAEVSQCARMPAEELITRYAEAGYGAVVVTDHYYERFHIRYEELNENERIDRYLEGYQKARKIGKKLGVEVLLGCEIRLTDKPNDYLLYGITEELLRNNVNMYKLKLADFAAFAKENKIMIYQAHPFRNEMQMISPALGFGTEVYNGNPRHDSRNDIAELWSRKYNTKQISGSDAHKPEDCAKGGIETDTDIENMSQLMGILQNGRYRLIKTVE